MVIPLVSTGEKCPECHKCQLVSRTRTEEFDFDLGDKTIRVRAESVPYQVCDHCKEELIGSEAVRMRHEAICRAAGYLSPAEYRAIRESFGWSQQYLADLTGYGVATVSRSERGRLLPNLSYDITLRAIRDCSAYRENLERLLASRTRRQIC
jgi:putative zinc finger/helix-turn-helix YgiT family protein